MFTSNDNNQQAARMQEPTKAVRNALRQHSQNAQLGNNLKSVQLKPKQKKSVQKCLTTCLNRWKSKRKCSKFFRRELVTLREDSERCEVPQVGTDD